MILQVSLHNWESLMFIIRS